MIKKNTIKPPLFVIRTDYWGQIHLFLSGFLSRTFMIHGAAGEGVGYLFNPSLPLPPAL